MDSRILSAPSAIPQVAATAMSIPSHRIAEKLPVGQRPSARSAPRIEDHGLIGNLRTAAIVDRRRSVDWMCMPRFDSAAVFANLLGSEEHGMWTLGPAGLGGTSPEVNRQRYLDGTLVLESTWLTPAGTVQILDLVPVGDETAQLVPSRTSPVTRTTSEDVRSG